jgi:hypothetical protein
MVPNGQKLVESTLFPCHFDPKYQCDDVESTWKTDWICKKSPTSGHVLFFHPTFNLNPMTW